MLDIMKEPLYVCLTGRSIRDALMQVKAELMRDAGNELLLVSALSQFGLGAPWAQILIPQSNQLPKLEKLHLI